MAEHHERMPSIAISRSTVNEPAETITRFPRAIASLVAEAHSRTDLVTILGGVLVCFSALAPTNAYAYLDPGAGTYALQGLIAGIAGGILSVRAYWRRIGGLFRRAKASPEAFPERPLSDGDA